MTKEMDLFKACEKLCENIKSEMPSADAYKLHIFVDSILIGETPAMALAEAKHLWDREHTSAIQEVTK